MTKAQADYPMPEVTEKLWRQKVEKELGGRNFDDHLIWKGLDGFSMEAWQKRLPDIVPALPPLKSAWKIVEPVFETDAEHANRHAHEALMSGAEALWFHKSFLGAAAEVAMKNIDLDIAPAFIREGNIFDPFHDFLRRGEMKNGPLKHDNIYINGNRLRQRGAGEVDEIALLLSQAIELLRSNLDIRKSIVVSGIGNAFLTETAKIRALRWLWSSLIANEGHSPENPRLFAVNLNTLHTSNDEHSNILRATSASLAAVAGGVSYIMIEPWDSFRHTGNTFSARISRNIQNLLKEEAHLDKNLNPTDGSFFIENLTAAIAEKAWSKVQEIEKEGGFMRFASTGKLKSMLEESAANTKKAYINEQKTLLGINRFAPAVQIAEVAPATGSYALLPDVLHLPSEIQKHRP